VIKPLGLRAVFRDPRAIVAAGLFLHLQLGVPYSYAVLRPALQREFGLNEVMAALPFSIILVAYTLGMLLGGPASDRFGPRGVALLGILAFAGGFALAGQAPSFFMFILAYGCLAGTGIGLAYMAAIAAAVRQYPHHRGTANGIVALGFGLSAAILASPILAMVTALGWRGAMGQMALVFLIGSLPLGLLLRYPDRPALPSIRDLDASPMGSRRLFWALWMGWACALTVGLGWLAQLPEFARIRGFSDAQVSSLVVVLGLTNGLGRPLVGWLGDRIGRFRVLAGASVSSLGFLGMLLLWPTTSMILLAAAGIGIGFGAWLVNMAPTAADCFGEASVGRTYGAFFTSFGVGAVIGPLAIGGLRAVSPHDEWGLTASGLVLALSAVLFSYARRLQPPLTVG